jgi:PhoPQ-activated pathogenicity-related protein
MKKKIILLFLFALASRSGWAQYSVSITTPVTAGVIAKIRPKVGCFRQNDTLRKITRIYGCYSREDQLMFTMS